MDGQGGAAMTRAMLLCAGKGSRLGSLSGRCPKPLMPVCDIPILKYGITHLVHHGITEIVINTHHRGKQIYEELGDGSSLGASIVYSQEDQLLGTGGGLLHALPLLDPENRDEPFLSLNGKLIFDLDIPALLQAYAEVGDSLGMMVVQSAGNALQWGAVDVQEEGPGMRVHNILGAGSYMFCGVHITRPSVVRKLPSGEACMVRQGYLPWLQAGQRVSAFVHKGGYFAEHSTPKRYLQSNIDLLQGQRLSHPPGPLSGVHPSAIIHPTAQILSPVRIGEGAKIGAECCIGPNVVVGSGCQIQAGVSLRDCVLWKNTEVIANAQNVIVTPDGVTEALGTDEVD